MQRAQGPFHLSSFPTFALLGSAAKWAPSTQRSSVFRGEWLNYYQGNTLESKCSVGALDKCELPSENTREWFPDLAGRLVPLCLFTVSVSCKRVLLNICNTKANKKKNIFI